jgi:hypothetical protein
MTNFEIVKVIMGDQPWYGAKCVFQHNDRKDGDNNMYEERIVLLKAENIDEALIRAENEAKQYVNELTECKYLGFVDVFNLFDETIEDGTEVYSLMRQSKLNKEKYLDNFYDTGLEQTTVS